MRRMVCILLPCLLCITMAGCGAPASPQPQSAGSSSTASADAATAPTLPAEVPYDEDTEFQTASPTGKAEDSLQTRIQSGEIVELTDGVCLDLDGDGTGEIIRFQPGAENGLSRLTTANRRIDFQAIETTGKFFAAALGRDSSVQLLVTEDGPSADPATHIFQYENGRLRQIGEVEGHAENFTRTAAGFCSFGRGQLLETWYHPKEYVIAQAGSLSVTEGAAIPSFVAEVPAGTYPMGTVVRLKRALPLLAAPDKDAAAAFRVEAGRLVSLSACDDREWVYIETVEQRGYSSGGWLRVKPGSYDGCIPEGAELSAGELFSGLDLWD